MAGFLGTIAGQVTLDIRRAVASYAALRAQNAKTVYALRGTGDSFTHTGRSMAVTGGIFVAAFGKAVSAAAEFERKMDFFQAVTDTNSAKMQQLSKYTLQVAQDTIYSSDEIAQGFIELGKSGVSAEQIMHGVGRAMANLGAAGDIPLIESGQILTSVIQQFGLKATQATHVTDLLAGAANASIADISDLGVSLKYVGGVANAAGLSFTDTTTAISLLAKAGIRGSTAGTSLRQMIVSLPGVTKPAADQLKALGIITKDGSNKFYDLHGNLKPLGQVFQILQNHMKGMTREQRLTALRTIFNNRALAAAAILTRDGAKGFRDMNNAMSKTTAAEVAHKRLDNLSGDIEILKGNIDTLVITAGGPFQETMRGWVQNITKLVQAFQNLSPGTQKLILQFIGLTGVALVVMGTFAIFIGTVLKFIVAAKNFAAGIRFILGLLPALGDVIAGVELAIEALAAAISLPFAIAIGVIVAVIAVFILLYKKVTPFRNLMNKIGSSFVNDFLHPIISGVQSAISWFSNFGSNMTKVWNTVKSAASSAINSILGFFTGIGSKIGSAFSGAISGIGHFIGSIVGFFKSLPGKVLGTITSFVSTVTRLLTFRNIGYAIGFMVGTVVKLFYNMGARVGVAVRTLVTKAVAFFKALPGRLGAFAKAAYTRVTSTFVSMRNRAVSAARSLVSGVVGFIKALPGRVGAFVARMAARAAAGFARAVSAAKRAGRNIVNGIVNGVKALPGRVGGFITKMAARVRSGGARAVAAAKRIGINIKNGVVHAIQGLPGLVGGISGRIVAAFEAKARAAAAAARHFAAGLWQGFKDGIGMNSPSYFEKAMWQITGTVADETKKLSRQTLQVQKMSKNMAKTQFGVDTSSMGLNSLASMTAQRRATNTLSDKLRIVAGQNPVTVQLPDKALSLNGELRLHPGSKATVQGWAGEQYEGEQDFATSLGRMKI